MKTELYRPASELSLPVPAGTAAGKPVLVGSLVGVTATKEGEGGNATGYATVLMDDRAYLLDVNGAITGAGQPVYIVAADNSLTMTATGNTLFGFTIPGPNGAYLTKAAGVGPAAVKLAKV